jgi:hypothetical protein
LEEAELLPSARQLPVDVQGKQTAWEPAPAKVPTAHARPAVYKVVLATACDTLTVYVPAPPAVPEVCATTMVSGSTAPIE